MGTMAPMCRHRCGDRCHCHICACVLAIPTSASFCTCSHRRYHHHHRCSCQTRVRWLHADGNYVRRHDTYEKVSFNFLMYFFRGSLCTPRKTPPGTRTLPSPIHLIETHFSISCSERSHSHREPVEAKSPKDGGGVPTKSMSLSSPGTSALSSPFMQNTLLNTPPHPPMSPSPERPAGGEIARIRTDEACARAAHERLAEGRRPDYMRRIARGDTQCSAGRVIAETPIKGRHIGLWGFQETSEETSKNGLWQADTVGTVVLHQNTLQRRPLPRACSNGQPLSPQGRRGRHQL